ncbi:helix-turn-helix transcriptional regulator [Nocardioides nitrophenolicus]|uniref:helix-turn-helix transcriptional regulator n=1 Tax=Nocardioides nitrophenolicus TaxID=60489 RepID=UPI00195BE2CC|nr:AraC family transcriptional regulator [Nocardioides nitrophenolicus]MBM7517965.1 AraC-like DNA-binding protein [Nocardioides nitrophenolicus]
MAGERFDVDPMMRALLRDLDLSVPRVLKRARLPGQLFAERPIELTVAEYYAFWRAIDDEAASAGRTDTAVAIGNAISVDLFSPPIFAALCSGDLATAATRLAAHKPLIGPLRTDVETDASGRLTITYRWPLGEDPPPLLATAELVFWMALARIGTREKVGPVAATLPRWIERSPSLTEFLGVRPTVAELPSITFSGLDAARPFLTENETMWRVFAPELRRRLFDLEAGATVADRVRAALHEALPAGDPSIAAVTSRLNVSARTLQRRLNAEGTSFQSVLARTREDLARHYLARPDLRTSDVAYLLGYADTNSFYRSFKTWTGTTPDALRGLVRSSPAEPRRR